MFTRILNTIRETISKSPSSNRTNVNSNNNKHSTESEYASSANSPRPSATEGLQNDNHSMLSRFSTSQSMPLSRSKSISEPISIGPARSSSVSGANKQSRRSSTLFGISNVTYDDYVQKDLISSSWS